MNEQVEYDVYENVFYEDAFHQRTKFHDHNRVDNYNRVDEETQNLDFVETHFFTKLAQFYRCRFYNSDFVFNNQLHQHLRIIYNKFRFFAKEAIVINSASTKKVIVMDFKSANKFIIIVIATAEALSLIIFHASKIVHSNVTNVTTKEHVFREHRFVTILIMFILTK